MNRLSDLLPVVEAVFRQRMEEVIAMEVVTELGLKKKSSKPKLLALCRSLAGGGGGGGGSALNLVAPDKDSQSVRVKQAFAVDRLRDVTHDGSFDATFNFGASGVFSASFESHIQREMFISAVRRQQQQQGGGGDNNGRGGGATGAGGGPPGRRAADDLTNIRGVLSAAVGAEAEADAASRVRRLRQEKRRVFTTEEEHHLLRCMGRSSFDDVQGFQEVLLRQQKASELASIDALVGSASAWDGARDHVTCLVQDVEELEGRIEQYSTHIMSKKSVLREIEHANNSLRQKQRNLEGLYVMMAELRDQLRLDGATTALLARLRGLPEDGNHTNHTNSSNSKGEEESRRQLVVSFFSQGTNAAVLSAAMAHMQRVLQNPRLDADYPIAAVAERKSFFLEQRKLIARRSQVYILSVIADAEAVMLADKPRYSRDNSIVWRLHAELSGRLLAIRDIIAALPRIDPEGFTSALRKYRTSMQKIYALEVCRFLKGLRRQVKRVSTWQGPFLLGSSESKGEAIAVRMETAQVGETPRMWRGGGGSASSGPPPSPALSPRMMTQDYDTININSPGYGFVSGSGGGGGGDRSSQVGSHDRAMLTIEFPSSPLFNTPAGLYADPQTLRRLDVRSASGSVISGVTGTSSGGHVRPDLAFGIALEAAVVSTLHEEYILRECFGIGRGDDNSKTATTTTAAVVNGSNGPTTTAAGPSWSVTAAAAAAAAEGEEVVEVSPAEAARRSAARREAAALTLESLLELFGGDKLRSLDSGGGGGPPGALNVGGGGVHSRQNSRDLGLPPRAPPQQQPQSFSGAAAISRSALNTLFNVGANVSTTSRPHSGGGGSGSNNSSIFSSDYDGYITINTNSGGDGGGGDAHGRPRSRATAVLTHDDVHRVRANYLVREMADLASFLGDKCDRIYAIPALCMIKAYRHGRRPVVSRSPFCQGMLQELETIVAGAMMRFVAEQTQSITRCRQKYIVKPTALLHCFAKMPAFILRLEAVHNSLSEEVCDRTEYGSIATSLVDQSFDALDSITNVKGGSTEAGKEARLSINELIAKKVHYALEGIAVDASSLKRAFIQQYRHHAFFCAFYVSLPAGAYAHGLLQEHHESSRMKRDRYEELYLTRVLLVADFPAFGVFALTAEDLSLVYSREELRHHRALAADGVKKICERLDKEMRSGIRESAARIKKHFLRDVNPSGSDVSFHKALLQRTWQHYGQLILQKFDFLSKLLTWEMYRGIQLPLTRAEVTEILAAF